MNRDELIAYTADCVLEQGGDIEAIFAVLRRELTGTEIETESNDLGQGELFALCALFVFQEVEDGAEQLRRIRDRHRSCPSTLHAEADGVGLARAPADTPQARGVL